MNRSESKYFNTARLFDEALIALLKIKDFDYITIKEICTKAGVNRSTFYLHYESINDLLEETIEMVNDRFISYFGNDTRGFVETMDDKDKDQLILISQQYLLPYLRFVKENKDLYRASLKNPVSMQVEHKTNYMRQYIVEPVLQRFDIPKTYWEYYIAYYVDGLFAIVKTWLDHGCQDEVETVAKVMEACVLPSSYFESIKNDNIQ